MKSFSLCVVAVLMGCSGSDGSQRSDASNPADSLSSSDGMSRDAGLVYSCGAFSEDPGWTVERGFRAVTVANADDGLSEPVALAFAGGSFDGKLYVINQGNATVSAIDVNSGDTTLFSSGSAWTDVAATYLTTIAWDEKNVFDGNLYVVDSVSTGDGNAVLYRLDDTGNGVAFAKPPGPALDEPYGLAFSPGGDYPAGLYVTGDTDGGGVDWGVFDEAGAGVPFSEVSGAETIAVDTEGNFGGLLYAALPTGGGWAGNDTISAINPDGTLGTAVTDEILGVHGIAFAPSGPFGDNLYAASWSSQQLLRVAPGGEVTTIASGLSLTNYNANILAFSPDGQTLLIADRLANQVVCIEPTE